MNPACVNRGGAESLILLESPAILEKEVSFSPQSLEKLTLWQVRAGEIVTVCDPQGTFYRCRITVLEKSSGKAVIFQRLARPPEAPIRIDVYQALPEKERFELILQKLTEIGVYRIIPYLSERSTTLELRDAGQKKSHRWPDVLLRAAKQCRRGIIPELSPVLPWKEALLTAGQAPTALVLSEKEESGCLAGFLKTPSRYEQIALFVGPEGGFSAVELAEMAAAGFVSLSLGPRILRTETAAIVGAALIQAFCGDFG